MYAKLFSRITESSLMEEPIETRYAFMGLLAISDPTGHVIGTDIAIARRLNMPLEQLKTALKPLLEPDADSNSPELEGRRIVPSQGERGYRIVNYLTYRKIRDEEHRREYMRTYINGYRSQGRDKSRPGKTGKHGKPGLANAELESEEEEKEESESQSGSGARANAKLKGDKRGLMPIGPPAFTIEPEKPLLSLDDVMRRAKGEWKPETVKKLYEERLKKGKWSDPCYCKEYEMEFAVDADMEEGR